MLTKRQILIGSGGHAGVVMDCVTQSELLLTDIVSPELVPERWAHVKFVHHTADDWILTQEPELVELINGVGSLPRSNVRKNIFERFAQHGFKFKTIIADSAVVSSLAKLNAGVQVLTAAIVQSHAQIGCNSIINTAAIIEHDCIIGRHNHIAPGAILCGSVKTADFVHVGCGARVLQSIEIGAGSIIAAGAVITKNVPAGVVAFTDRFESI